MHKLPESGLMEDEHRVRQDQKRVDPGNRGEGAVEVVRIAAHDEAAEAGHFDALVDFLAHDEIQREVRFAGPGEGGA